MHTETLHTLHSAHLHIMFTETLHTLHSAHLHIMHTETLHTLVPSVMKSEITRVSSTETCILEL